MVRVTYPRDQAVLQNLRKRVREVGIWFVPVPRVASRSIRLELGGTYGILFAHDGVVRGHGLASDYRDLFGTDIWNKIFSFGFVRNPWDRMVSGYHHRDLGMSFEQWINNRSWGQFSTPQSMFVLDEAGRQIVSFVGRYEEFQADMHYLHKKLGIGTIGHTHQSRRDYYPEYYNDKTRDIIADSFALDIAHFGYRFGE